MVWKYLTFSMIWKEKIDSLTNQVKAKVHLNSSSQFHVLKMPLTNWYQWRSVEISKIIQLEIQVPFYHFAQKKSIRSQKVSITVGLEKNVFRNAPKLNPKTIWVKKQSKVTLRTVEISLTQLNTDQSFSYENRQIHHRKVNHF